jgi:murein L,D-transpeptidase YafK
MALARNGVRRWIGLLFATLLVALAAGYGALVRSGGSPLPQGARADRILIDKSDRMLVLYEGETVLKRYPVALGRVPEGPKRAVGDGRTPEGRYVIDWRNAESCCHLSLHISYPDASDRRRAGAAGVSPGGDIMIHGLRNGMAWLGALHRLADWTSGCVAVTNTEMDEIWRAVPNGTAVEIRS